MMGNVYSVLSMIGIDALNKMMDYAKMHFAFEESYIAFLFHLCKIKAIFYSEHTTI
jgi:hemerythrin